MNVFLQRLCFATCPFVPHAPSQAVPVQDVSVPEARASWPQWLGGPERSGQPRSLQPTFGDPAILQVEWRHAFGPGYSSISTWGDIGIVLHTADEDDVVSAFDVRSGSPRWTRVMEPKRVGMDGALDGPLSTPAIDGGSVFALSAKGVLFCLELETGSLRWKQDLVGAHGAEPPHFGMATSPLVDSGLVIVAGGGAGRTLLAVDVETGEPRWANGTLSMEYGSPTAVTLDSVRQVVILGDSDGVLSLRIEDGAELWRLEARTDGWSTPIPIQEDHLFLPLERRGIAVRCTQEDGEWTVETAWERPLRPYGSFFAYRDGRLFGASKIRAMCLDPTTGEEVWVQRVRQGGTVFASDLMIRLHRDTGILRGFSTVGTECRQLFEHSLPEGEYWSPPSVAGELILVRGEEEVVALAAAE